MLKPRTILQALLAGLAYAAGLYLVWLFLPLPGNWRPAAGLAPALGLLFGPAGAAAAALGNFLFDLRDEIDFGTFPGVLGNFFFAYLPYRVAGHLPGFERRPRFSARWILFYLYLALLGAAACGTVIGFGLELPRLAAFGVRGVGITLSNFVCAAMLGWLPLFLYSGLASRGWAYLPPPAVPSRRKTVGFWMMQVGLLAAFIPGALTSAGVIPPLADYLVGGSQAPAAGPIMAPGMVLFFLGAILL